MRKKLPNMPEEIDKLTPLRARKRRPGDRMTTEERKAAQAKFIEALGRTANITAACLHAGISRSIVYVWQEHFPDFSLEFQEANKRANDLLFGEAWRRALQGEERYYISQGKVVYGPDGKPATYHEKSDRLLELLLKARLSEFREKQQVEHSGSLEVLNGARDALLADLGMLPDVSQSQEHQQSAGANTL